MSLSKIVVSGRVVKAPEKRFTPSTNIAVTEFAIAVETPARNDGPPETQAVKVTTWRDLAERCAQEIHKGDLVAVDGRLQVNNMTTSDGQRRRDVEIDAVAVENLSNSVALTHSDDVGEDRALRASAKPAGRTVAPVSAHNKGEDLDSIFASEEEIPF